MGRSASSKNKKESSGEGMLSNLKKTMTYTAAFFAALRGAIWGRGRLCF